MTPGHPPHPWAAPTTTTPLNATVQVPGSKSLTNRLLILAAIADGTSTLTGALRSRDADLMIAGLQSLGVTVTEGTLPSTLTITPGKLIGGTTIHCGLAGTVMRFLPPVAALARGQVTFDGDPEARRRPMGPILTALGDLGIQITESNDSPESAGPGLPFTLHGVGQVSGGTVTINASTSSQFISGLLLAAPRFTYGLTIRHHGSTVPSTPHIDMTVDVLRRSGITVDDSTPLTWRVEPGPIAAQSWHVEPDLSNAGIFLAAALVAGGTVRVPGWPHHTTQPGAAFADLLAMMGASVDHDGDTLCVSGTGIIHGIDVDLRDTGELAPTIAALAALAETPSRLRGISHLRGHETDRLAALTTEIRRLGGQCRETDDGLAIDPAPLHGGEFHSYHDHRMAMAGALIGLRVPGVTVENIATTAKTLPEFTTLWQQMVTSS